MEIIGQRFPVAAVFGASGGIGRALVGSLAQSGVGTIYAGSRSGNVTEGEAIAPFRFDLDEPSSLADAAEAMAANPPNLVLVATGVLTLDNGKGPEKTYRHLEAGTMSNVFLLNTIGPAMIARHILPILKRDARNVFAALSARVGSISDNRLGGWHSYRASKAALNMLIKNFAIEVSRTHDQTAVVGLHPGTVDTELSEPFQSNVPDKQLFSPEQSARYLLDIIEGIDADDSGKVYDWEGKQIPW